MNINWAKARINVPVEELAEIAVAKEGLVKTSTGAINVITGKYTGRSPMDRFIVDEPSIHDQINWGPSNLMISKENFEKLYAKVQAYIEDKDLYVFHGFVGATEKYRMPVRVINELAFQNLFVQNMFRRPTKQELENFEPGFTVISVPSLHGDPATDGINSEAFVIVSFEKKVILIGGTKYSGEMKKSIFSVMNYLLPLQGVLPMHCSANVGENGDVALFFGLSGTGKTTLSADENRMLIGDDEHGWDDEGVFNFEGGCYAKCVKLSQENEPQIWNAIRPGTLLENIVLDDKNVADYDDIFYTENTRAAYPVEFIDNAKLDGFAGVPKTIVFLTADATGVFPPIAKLTKEQAMYYFMSGYTSKLAGTERGIINPTSTFSTCFGGPFMPLKPQVYAELLGKKIEKYNTNVYLVNTGWAGGPFGIGDRMKLKYTRSMVTAALNGDLEKSHYVEDRILGVQVPTDCPNVPGIILNPPNIWFSIDEYFKAANRLAYNFTKNFEQFKGVSEAIVNAGPKQVDLL